MADSTTTDKLVWWVMGVIGAILLSIAGSWHSSLKNELASLQNQAARREEIAYLRADFEAVRIEQARRGERMSRLEADNINVKDNLIAIRSELRDLNSYLGANRVTK